MFEADKFADREQLDRARRENRCKAVALSERFAAELLNAFRCAGPEGGSAHLSAPWFPELPSGYEVERVLVDGFNRRILVIVVHPSFDPVPFGREIPPIQARYMAVELRGHGLEDGSFLLEPTEQAAKNVAVKSVRDAIVGGIEVMRENRAEVIRAEYGKGLSGDDFMRFIGAPQAGPLASGTAGGVALPNDDGRGKPAPPDPFAKDWSEDAPVSDRTERAASILASNESWSSPGNPRKDLERAKEKILGATGKDIPTPAIVAPDWRAFRGSDAMVWFQATYRGEAVGATGYVGIDDRLTVVSVMPLKPSFVPHKGGLVAKGTRLRITDDGLIDDDATQAPAEAAPAEPDDAPRRINFGEFLGPA